MAKKTATATAKPPLQGKLAKKDAVQAVAEMIADGYTDYGICQALEARRIPAPRGGKKWYTGAIRTMRKRGLIAATRDKPLPVRRDAVMWACVMSAPGVWTCTPHAADEGRAIDAALNAVREARANGASKACVVPDAKLAQFMALHGSDMFDLVGSPAVAAK